MGSSNGQSIHRDDQVTPVYQPGPRALREVLQFLPVPIMLWLPRDTDDPGSSVLVFANKAASAESGAPITWMFPGTIRQLFPESMDEPVHENLPRAIIRVWTSKRVEEIVTTYGDRKYIIYLYPICAGVVCIYRADKIR